MRENDLHNAFIKFLDKANIAYIHSNTHKRSSTTPGDPDFVLLKNGYNLSIEFKMIGNKQSEDQVKRQRAIEAAHNHYYIAFDVETAVDYANAWVSYPNPEV